MEKLRVLEGAELLSNEIWQIVMRWGEFARNSVGQQVVRSADSIGANIAESLGRYHYGEKVNFLYYTRGSLFETKYWLNQCHSRSLIDTNTYTKFAAQLEIIGKQLNALVKTTKQARNSGQAIKENQATYQINQTKHLIIPSEELVWLGSLPQYPIPNIQLPPKERIHGTSS